MYIYPIEQADKYPIVFSDGPSFRVQKPKTMASVSSSFCSVNIANSCGSVFTCSNVERLEANSFIVDSLTSILGEGHGYKMLAQSLTEAVCIRKEVDASSVFQHAGMNYVIVVK